jgi:hypothetical protein
MQFSSIKEFFYKLQSISYIVLLLPLAVTIVWYVVPRAADLLILVEDQQLIELLRVAFPLFALAELTTVHLVIHSKLKKIIPMPGLGDRLDKYVPLSFIRIVSSMTVSLVMLIGLFITHDVWFMGYAATMILIIFLQRPTPQRVSRQLKLKGNERELIIKGELK